MNKTQILQENKEAKQRQLACLVEIRNKIDKQIEELKACNMTVVAITTDLQSNLNPLNTGKI